MMMCNSVGVIDSDYRGEITVRFKVLDDLSVGVHKYSKIYKQGDKVAQLILVEVPKIDVLEVNKLSDTERGENGYGSTGH
jgi:dUTP pyrophosphatase